MSREKFSNLIAEALELKIFQIAIGGGEPLLHNDLIKIYTDDLKYAYVLKHNFKRIFAQERVSY